MTRTSGQAAGQAAPLEPAGQPSRSKGSAELPLPTLLSQVLVAFTIEFDNEFEHQMPHRTTASRPAAASSPAAGSRPGAWLTSMAMWSNFMQFVAEDGAPLSELEDLARMTNLGGLERWGYVVVEPDPADSRPKPPRRDWVVRPTAAGRSARQVWRPLAGMIEQRWQERFGAGEIGRLRESLSALVSRLGAGLPCYLPVLGHAMFASLRLEAPGAGREGRAAPPLDLPALLSRVLLAFTIDFERESDLSLPISANALRVLGEQAVRIRDLPRLTGVSKEAIGMSVGFLERNGYLAVEPDPAPASRAKLARLTPKGLRAQDQYRRLLGVIEERWQERFGKDDISTLRDSLQRLLAQPGDGDRPRMSEGLLPPPGGWRGRNPYLTHTMTVARDPSGALPHYPMVLHRGGWPDGS